MSDVIKVNHLERDTVKKIYVFSGKRAITKSYPWALIDGSVVFTTNELKNIKDNSINVEIVEGYLHGDDTIATIKKKIIKYTEIRVSAKELYLFGIKTQTINPSILYNQLTQNDSYKLTGGRMCQFLLNIVSQNCDDVAPECPLVEKANNIYDFEDMMTIDGIEWGSALTYTFPIGQKLVMKKKYPYVSNPYNCVTMDEIIKKKASDMVSTQNSNLLFEYGAICNNNIFICLAEEVLKYASITPDITEHEFINLYFPNLSLKHKITSLSQLKDQQVALYDEEERSLDEKFNKYNDRVDLLYDIYYKRKSDLEYIENTPGILKTTFTIHPKYPMKMPLEMLFKLINSNTTIPLVKYNPGRDRENIYRLFSNNTATNGKKIPLLYTNNDNRKGKIIRLSKLLARKKRVAYYIEYNNDGIDYAIDCEFEINGNVNITVQHSSLVKRPALEEALRNTINPYVLKKVQKFLEQSGYTFQIFESFDEDNIEFKDITLISMLEIKKKIKLKSYTSCLSSVFTIIDEDLSSQQEELRLKYKRVSNYNELDSIDSFINEMRKNDEESGIIIRKLYQNFNISEDEARARFANWASQINVETDLFENKAITIRTNTGFPIKITRNNANFVTSVKTTNINNIGYLRFISIYIDSLLRLIAKKTSTSVSSKTITSLCKGKSITIVAPEQDIVTHKIRFREDVENATSFLEIFGDTVEDGDDDEDGEIDFTDVVFGSFTPSDDSPSGKESKQSASDDFDFGNIEFGNFDDIMDEEADLPKPQTIVRQLSEVGELPEEKVDGPSNISPQSDVSSDIEVNLKGLPLKGTNNIFMKRKETLEPSLFLKKDDGRYKAYSKSCPSQYAKQPMILTTNEKKYIDSKDDEFGTKSYDEHITYGTGDTKYHYICPRFWCLSDKNGKPRSLSLKEINEGACGGWDALVPEGSAKVPDGKRIVEFTDGRMHKSGTRTSNLMVYKPMFPSFMDKGKHPSKFCIPCCFTRPTTLDPKKSGWIIRKNDNEKEEYYNTKTKEVRSKYPLIEYDDMYKPIGDGPGGPGPTYETDDNGNIKLDTVKGTKEVRDAPANARKTVYNSCNQSANKTKFSVKAKSIKIDDAPLLEAWPLNPGQIGYIPLQLQKFLGYSCRKLCQESLTDNGLKFNTPCLLHKGVEKSDTQSFLACIADIFAHAQDTKLENKEIALTSRPPMTIKQLKTVIIKQLSIDRFSELQNGDLINIFSDPSSEIDISPYKKSNLYKSLNSTTDGNVFFNKVVSAFINFGKYIMDDSIVIDYKYLWDFVSLPISNGSGLFEDGINMIILKSPEDDITSKIELICPTNYYSENVYDINRQTVILYTRNGYFEPIYKYTKMRKRVYAVTKLFNIRNIMRELPEVGAIIKHIWTDLTVKCKPLPSMPDEYNQKYDFKTNIELVKILRILTESNSVYVFKTQVANYNSRVIGVVLQKGDDENDQIFIPSLPSALDNNKPMLFDNSGRDIPLNNYENTILRLKYLKKTSDNKLLCEPKFKLVNDSVIIGVITETNQVVPIAPEEYQVPVGGDKDDIPAIIKKISPNSFNYIKQDNTLLTTSTVDEERVKKVRNIKLESHFYNVFRNMIRIVLAYYENKDLKNQLLDTILSPTVSYYEKLKAVEDGLKRIMAKFVIFSKFTESSLTKMGEIEVCLNITEDEKCNQKEYCTFSPSDGTSSDICKILLPKYNLISEGDNENQYFARVANELIKFDRIRTFIFIPKTFLSFQNISYNLSENEIILLEDLLYGDYFEDLVPQKINPYIKNVSTWGISEPSVSVPYANTFNMSYDIQDKMINQCIVIDSQSKKLTLGRWKENGFADYNIQEYKSSNNCSWEIMKDILNIHYPSKKIDTKVLLRELVGFYQNLQDKPEFIVILNILKKQGKKSQVQSILNSVSISDIITPSNYYLSTLDFAILAYKFKLPLAVLCRTKIPTLFSQYVSFISEGVENCYIIFSGNYSNIDTNHSPVYGLLSKNDSIQLNIEEMGDAFSKITKINITNIKSFITRTNLAKQLNQRGKPKIKVKLNTYNKKVKSVKKMKSKIKL